MEKKHERKRWTRRGADAQVVVHTHEWTVDGRKAPAIAKAWQGSTRWQIPFINNRNQSHRLEEGTEQGCAMTMYPPSYLKGKAFNARMLTLVPVANCQCRGLPPNRSRHGRRSNIHGVEKKRDGNQ